MDARHYSGDYDCDHESVEEPICDYCQATDSQPCEDWCPCPQCRSTRAKADVRGDAA